MCLNCYFKQKWLEKLLWADGKGCSNQGQFYLGGVGETGIWQKKKKVEELPRAEGNGKQESGGTADRNTVPRQPPPRRVEMSFSSPL